tara:strand:- start:2859 stop:3536 length:678 start_codon:yes stop_codon:yes gene_type:complete
MSIDEMHKEFMILIDKADSGGAPSFLPSEIDVFLNAAIERFVSKRAFGNNPRRTTFEEDQKRRDDLRNLILQDTINPENVDLSGANKINGIFVRLPRNYRHAINEEAQIELSDRSLHTVSVKPITHDRYNKIIDDPFNKPEQHTVYRLDYSGDRFELICGEGTRLSKYYLRYIKHPNVVDYSDNKGCDLSEHTHREIVRMAVLEALENIESPRYQSSKIELNEIE